MDAVKDELDVEDVFGVEDESGIDPSIAAAMGFSSFGAQTSPKKRKRNSETGESSGSNSIALGSGKGTRGRSSREGGVPRRSRAIQTASLVALPHHEGFVAPGRKPRRSLYGNGTDFEGAETLAYVEQRPPSLPEPADISQAAAPAGYSDPGRLTSGGAIQDRTGNITQILSAEDSRPLLAEGVDKVDRYYGHALDSDGENETADVQHPDGFMEKPAENTNLSAVPQPDKYHSRLEVGSGLLPSRMPLRGELYGGTSSQSLPGTHARNALHEGQKQQRYDWAALRKGVPNNRGDVAYYDISFVGDPWARLRGGGPGGEA
ncbi:hypothetical protein MMC09_000359 [Bachmanniomyces sp. S44760]|nr:hypothetical protein [Bachmanniomyces sp. S44760]